MCITPEPDEPQLEAEQSAPASKVWPLKGFWKPRWIPESFQKPEEIKEPEADFDSDPFSMELDEKDPIPFDEDLEERIMWCRRSFQ